MTAAVWAYARTRIAFPVLALAALLSACRGGGNDEPPVLPTAAPPLVAGQRIAFINSDNNLALMNSDGSELSVITESGGVQAFSWSGDGSRVAVDRQLPTGRTLSVLRPDGSVVFEQTGATEPRWSPDGTRFAMKVGDAIQVVDASGAVVRTILSAALPAWSPDGSRLAVLKLSQGSGVPVVATLATGEETPLSADIAPQPLTSPIAWHPASDVVGYGTVLYDLSNGVRREVPGTAVEWSPDGRTLVIALPDPQQFGTTLFQLLDADQDFKPAIGLELPPAADATPPALFLSNWTGWSPDGRYLVYLDPTATRERARIFDTVMVSQERLSDIKGEQPSVSGGQAVAAFMDSGKVWVLPVDGSSLNAIADGSWPAWVLADG